MTPLTAMPRPSARPRSHPDREDHRPHLSGGARYAIGNQSRVQCPSAGSLNTWRRARRRGQGAGQ
jgi:hypothetical protein